MVTGGYAMETRAANNTFSPPFACWLGNTLPEQTRINTQDKAASRDFESVIRFGSMISRVHMGLTCMYS